MRGGAGGQYDEVIRLQDTRSSETISTQALQISKTTTEQSMNSSQPASPSNALSKQAGESTRPKDQEEDAEESGTILACRKYRLSIAARKEG